MGIIAVTHFYLQGPAFSNGLNRIYVQVSQFDVSGKRKRKAILHLSFPHQSSSPLGVPPDWALKILTAHFPPHTRKKGIAAPLDQPPDRVDYPKHQDWCLPSTLTQLMWQGDDNKIWHISLNSDQLHDKLSRRLGYWELEICRLDAVNIAGRKDGAVIGRCRL